MPAAHATPRGAGAVATAPAPYGWNRPEEGNPAGEWDRWRTGAAEEAPFLVRPGHHGDPGLLTPSTVPAHKAELAVLGPLECHGGPRGLLDFDAMRQRAVRENDALAEAWREMSARHPVAREGLCADAVLVELLCHA
ncbi:hypothetical protein [Streptomyces sp. NPDC048191]|uniref:hypothetical protein n=1 Tax=Streptomyces sp. NPDC048191 TaxID=3155484 RepID=UPI0033D89E61